MSALAVNRAIIIVRDHMMTILQGQSAAASVALSDNTEAKSSISQLYLRDGDVTACGMMGLRRCWGKQPHRAVRGMRVQHVQLCPTQNA